jgi:DNA-binding response OmpR family regulator
MAHILVVDDHPDLATVVARLLARSGHDAACADDGQSALDHVRTTPTAMVILDVMMPGLDGFDVLREMRADPRTRGVPVVMYSARGDPAAKRRAADLGA